jgi:hypothetical protein
MTAGSGAEATQLINYSRRVKEGMSMGTVYRDLPVPVAHRPTTYLAINSFNRAGFFFFLFLAYRATEPTTPLSVVVQKTIDGVICYLHCNSPQ